MAATLRVNRQTGEVSFGKGFFPGECIDGVIRGSIPGTFLTAQFILSLQTVTMVAPKRPTGRRRSVKGRKRASTVRDPA